MNGGEIHDNERRLSSPITCLAAGLAQSKQGKCKLEEGRKFGGLWMGVPGLAVSPDPAAC